MSRQCWPVLVPSVTSASCPASTRRCTRGRPHASKREGRLVGYLGALHPELAKKLDLEQPVFLFELLLAEVVDGHLPKFRELSRFPEVRRDLALLVDQDVPAQDILTQIRAAAGEWLTDLRLFDVYHGKGIDPHRKALPSA